MNSVIFSSCIVTEDKLWFVTQDPYFMNMDIYTQECEFVEVQNIENISFGQVFNSMLVNGREIFWVERDGKHLVRYSIEEKVCKFYDLPPVEYKNWLCFWGIALFQSKIYIFSRHTPVIIIFDIVDESYLVEDSFYLELKGQMPAGMVVDNDVVYFFGDDGESIVKFFLNDASYSIEKLPKRLINIISASMSGECVYFLCERGICVWNIVSNEFEKEYGFDNNDRAFSRIAISKEKIFLLPEREGEILVINRKTGEYKELNDRPDDFRFSIHQWANYEEYFENEEYIWYAIRSANYYLRIDKINSKAEWFKPLPPSDEEHWRYCLKIRKTFYSEGEIDLPLFLKYDFHQDDKPAGQNIGQQIWEKL